MSALRRALKQIKPGEIKYSLPKIFLLPKWKSLF